MEFFFFFFYLFLHRALHLLNNLKRHTELLRKLAFAECHNEGTIVLPALRDALSFGFKSTGASASFQKTPVERELKTHILTLPQHWAWIISFVCNKIDQRLVLHICRKMVRFVTVLSNYSNSLHSVGAGKEGRTKKWCWVYQLSFSLSVFVGKGTA